MVKPQFELGRERVGRGVVRDLGDRREAILGVALAARELGLPIRGFASSGLPGPKGNRETFVWCGGSGAEVDRPGGGDRRGGARAMKTAALITHSHPPAATEAVAIATAVAARGRLAPGRHRRGDRQAQPCGRRRRAGRVSCRPIPTSASCSAATARSSTRCAASPAPAFPSSASTSAPSASSPRSSATRPRQGIRRALAGETETIDLPALAVEIDGEERFAFNDVSFSRRPEDRVAELSYRIAGEEVGNVRCDGLVAATPAGSTGYNLANQGPILAWGVKGYVVSYISPHSLTARALVVAPSDVLTVGNAAGREPVDVAVDGAHAGRSHPGAALDVRFVDAVGCLAQLPGTSFYHRIREKFGHLAV